MKVKIELEQEDIDLLIRCHKQGYLEYRDSQYQTVEEFCSSKEQMPIEKFKARNEDGTLQIAYELKRFHFLKEVEDAWHVTFVLTKLGEKEVQDKTFWK